MAVRILALVGDYWHPAEIIKKGLQSALSTEDYQLTLVHTYEHIPWHQLQQVDVLVLSQWGKIRYDLPNEGNQWMTEEIQQQITDFIEQGGGLLALHSGLSDQPVEGRYRELIKGHFVHHPSEHPVITVTLDGTEHPVSTGLQAFEITDEQYFVEVDTQHTEVLLTGTSEAHGASPVLWAHPWGKGRVCGFTPGHTEAVLMHPDVQRLLKRITHWLVQK